MEKYKQNARIFSWLFQVSFRYKGKLLLMMFLHLLISGCSLVVPMYFKLFIDFIIPSKNMFLFAVFLGLIFAVISIIPLLNKAREICISTIILNSIKNIQLQTLKKQRELGFDYFDKKPVSEQLSMYSGDIDYINNIYDVLFRTVFAKFFTLSIALIIILIVDYTMFLFILFIIILYLLAGLPFEKRKAEADKKIAKSRKEYNTVTYETIASIPTVRSYNSQIWVVKKFVKYLTSFNHNFIKGIMVGFYTGSARQIILLVGRIIVLIISFLRIKSGSIILSDFILVNTYYFLCFSNLTEMSSRIVDMFSYLHHAKFIIDFLDNEATIVEPKQPINNIISGKIEFRNINFQYNTDKQILKNINFTINKGERLALVGKSGSGKSTIIKLIARFYDPYSGEILIDDISNKMYSFENLRESIGFIFQDPFIYSMSVKDNILFGRPDATLNEVIDASKKAMADEFITQLKDGYETVLGKRGYDLSSGQKQRLAIARIMLKNPNVIILDEATSNLDNINEMYIKKMFETYFVDKTLIVIAHRFSIIAGLKKILVIDDGVIVERGSYDELIEKRCEFYNLYKYQNDDTRRE